MKGVIALSLLSILPCFGQHEEHAAHTAPQQKMSPDHDNMPGMKAPIGTEAQPAMAMAIAGCASVPIGAFMPGMLSWSGDIFCCGAVCAACSSCWPKQGKIDSRLSAMTPFISLKLITMNLTYWNFRGTRKVT